MLDQLRRCYSRIFKSENTICDETAGCSAQISFAFDGCRPVYWGGALFWGVAHIRRTRTRESRLAASRQRSCQHAIPKPGPNQSQQRQEPEGGLGLSYWCTRSVG